MFRQLYAITKFIVQHPLNANRKLRAISTFLRWQIGTRLLNSKVIVPWVDNSKFIAGLGETGLTGNLYTGLIEYEDMLFLLHALQTTDTFVDVGANVGAYTILASKVVGSRSIAFEPLPETVERLRDQVLINKIGEIVDVRNIGVGERKGALFFTNNYDTVNRVSLVGKTKNSTRVEVVALDEELTPGVPYFFKIDVEGFEYHVITGATKLLSSNSVTAVILELNGSGEEFGHSNEEVHQKLLALGFHPVSYNPLGRVLMKLSSYNRSGGNTIYVKDIDSISARCAASKKRVVHTAGGIFI